MAVDPGMVKKYCYVCGLETFHSTIFFTEEGHKAFVHRDVNQITRCESKAERDPRLHRDSPRPELEGVKRRGILYAENAEGFDRPLPEWEYLVERVN